MKIEVEAVEEYPVHIITRRGDGIEVDDALVARLDAAMREYKWAQEVLSEIYDELAKKPQYRLKEITGETDGQLLGRI